MGTSFYAYIVVLVLVIGVVKVATSIILSLNESRMQKKRNEQLDTQNKKKIKNEDSDEQLKQVINKITSPIIDGVLTKKTPKNLNKFQRRLKSAGWDKFFTPMQWIAFSMILGAVGIFFFIVFGTQSVPFGAIFFAFFAIGPNFLLNNSYNNRTENLLINFPETVRIISGYLSAGLLLPEAFKETAKDASPAWKPLLEEFVAKCNATDILTALDWFKEEVDIVEAREFFATVRLSLELGSSAKNGFAEQADRIQQLLRDSMQKRIEKRKVWATIVQGPILLCVMAAFALPLVATLGDIF